MIIIKWREEWLNIPAETYRRSCVLIQQIIWIVYGGIQSISYKLRRRCVGKTLTHIHGIVFFIEGCKFTPNIWWDLPETPWQSEFLFDRLIRHFQNKMELILDLNEQRPMISNGRRDLRKFKNTKSRRQCLFGIYIYRRFVVHRYTLSQPTWDPWEPFTFISVIYSVGDTECQSGGDSGEWLAS